MIRALSVALATLALLSIPGANAAQTAPHGFLDADRGCGLFVSVPNPCDPDSAN